MVLFSNITSRSILVKIASVQIVHKRYKTGPVHFLDNNGIQTTIHLTKIQGGLLLFTKTFKDGSNWCHLCDTISETTHSTSQRLQ